MRQHVPGSKRRIGVVAAAAALALALGGCVSAVDVEGGDPTPQAGGVLHIVQGADIQPATIMAQNNPNFSITRSVFNSLIRYDHETQEPQPELATEWELSDDGLTLRSRCAKASPSMTGSRSPRPM